MTSCWRSITVNGNAVKRFRVCVVPPLLFFFFLGGFLRVCLFIHICVVLHPPRGVRSNRLRRSGVNLTIHVAAERRGGDREGGRAGEFLLEDERDSFFEPAIRGLHGAPRRAGDLFLLSYTTVSTWHRGSKSYSGQAAVAI